MNWQDVFERAGWTFVQGALGAVTAIPIVTDVEGWAAVGVAAVTGGISSLVSFVKTVAQERLIVPETRAHVPAHAEGAE